MSYFGVVLYRGGRASDQGGDLLCFADFVIADKSRKLYAEFKQLFLALIPQADNLGTAVAGSLRVNC